MSLVQAVVFIGSTRSRTRQEPGAWQAPSWRISNAFLSADLLHVRNFPVQESHFQIFVHVDLFGPEIHFLLGLAHGRLDLVRSHSLFDARRLSLRLLRSWLLLALVLASLLLLSSLISALLLTTLILLRVVVAD